MKQKICFHALQSFPIEQQRNMVARLQQQNEQCDEKSNDENLILESNNKPKQFDDKSN